MYKSPKTPGKNTSNPKQKHGEQADESKALVRQKVQKVLFAEAEKEFVDFLLTLLALPVASVSRLLKNHSMVGCIGNLYESIENLSDTYIQSGQTKNILLNPVSPSLPSAQIHPLLLEDGATGTSMKFYSCNSFHYVTDVYGGPCPSCKNGMTNERAFAVPHAGNSSQEKVGGFVKGVVTYTVMDDLVVKPMSTISSITVLNKFNVQDVVHLEENVVEVGMKEGLAILKALFNSKKVLTEVFLGSGTKKLMTAVVFCFHFDK